VRHHSNGGRREDRVCGPSNARSGVAPVAVSESTWIKAFACALMNRGGFGSPWKCFTNSALPTPCSCGEVRPSDGPVRRKGRRFCRASVAAIRVAARLRVSRQAARANTASRQTDLTHESSGGQDISHENHRDTFTLLGRLRGTQHWKPATRRQMTTPKKEHNQSLKITRFRISLRCSCLSKASDGRE
jgi:hypothetical protein